MTNTEFLHSLFGRIPVGQCLWATQFPGNPNGDTARWKGFSVDSYETMFPTQPGHNQYYCVSSLGGMGPRQKGNFIAMHVLVLDDAGEVDSEVTYKLETSPGKVHIGFKLNEPIRDAGIATRLVGEAIKHGMVVADTSGNNIVRYVRLPEGWNGKHSPPFKCVMHDWNPDLTFSVEELAELLGLDLDYIMNGGASTAGGRMHSDDDVNPDSHYARLIISGQSYHEPLLKLSARYVVRGAPDAVVIDFLRSLMDMSVGPRDARWTSRYAEIERYTREARAKFSYDQAEASTVDVEFGAISEMEEAVAKLTPRVIVDNLVYADVGAIISAGGTGKTTVELYKMALMALGRPVWGRTTMGVVRSAFFTKEDSREQLAARMREVKKALGLTKEESAQVRDNTRIIQLPGNFRVSAVSGDVVIPHDGHIKWLGDQIASFRPDRMIFDPMVSFGVGESRVNDAEQGIVEAMRCFRDRFECSAEVIHHSGKQNARDGTLDMYSSRGGSALPDGCRMVTVMQPLTPDEFRKLTGATISDEDDSGLVIAFPKISHCRPQDATYLRRTGYGFEMVTPLPESERERRDNMAIENQLYQFIYDQEGQGNQWNQAGLAAIKDQLNLSKHAIEGGLARLKASGSILEIRDEKDRRKVHFQCMTRS